MGEDNLVVMASLAEHPHDATAAALSRRLGAPCDPTTVSLTLARLTAHGLLLRSDGFHGLSTRGWRTLRVLQRACC